MSTALKERGNNKMNRKILSISSKRQITIPQKFYQTLGFGDEAECVMRGNELVIRPIKTVDGGEFAEQILKKADITPITVKSGADELTRTDAAKFVLQIRTQKQESATPGKEEE